MFMAARIRATETNKQHIHHPYCKGTYLTFLVMTSYELNLLFAILKPHNLSNYNRSVSSAICWCRPYTMVQFMYINKVDQTGRQPQETIVLSWIWLWCYINKVDQTGRQPQETIVWVESDCDVTLIKWIRLGGSHKKLLFELNLTVMLH